MNFCLMRCLNILGTRFTYNNPHHIDLNQPIIMISNHQSIADISPISWYMRRYHPKFISKIELGKGIPSVSFNLTHGGSVLIDRKNPRQSVPALIKFGEYIEKTKRMAVIFPEGTRSINGEPKPFYTKGLEILFKKAPSAIIVPLTINNSWKTQKYGKFPLGLGAHITFTIHKPVKINTFVNTEALINNIETTIKEHITIKT
jgi:1-acyl-sn-glycerol-3-phosphate acyltransferase